MKYTELEEYVKQAREDGKSDEQIREELIDAGWKKSDVLEYVPDVLPIPKPPSAPRPDYASQVPHTVGLWDTFENILLFISLYVLAVSIGLILHTMIDQWVPGLQNSMYSYQSTVNDFVLRSSLASLIVASPVYSFLFLRSADRTLRFPELKKTMYRKILYYITLIVTFVIMLVNVILTVYSFLNGNVQVNSLLHFVITVGISALIFAYYLNQTKEDRRNYV